MHILLLVETYSIFCLQGSYAPVKEIYSSEFRALVGGYSIFKMLQYYVVLYICMHEIVLYSSIWYCIFFVSMISVYNTHCIQR